MSIFDGLFGGGDCGREPSKDKSYHPEEHRYGFPGHSRDTKSYDAGSPTTGQTWSELDPAGNGGDRGAWWWWMTRVDWLALRLR